MVLGKCILCILWIIVYSTLTIFRMVYLCLICFNTVYHTYTYIYLYLCSGMRLSLPPSIDSVPITSVTAYDISSVANEVYNHNFHHNRSSKLDNKGGKLCPKLVCVSIHVYVYRTLCIYCCIYFCVCIILLFIYIYIHIYTYLYILIYTYLHV